MSIFPAISLILSFIEGACAFNLSDIEPNEPPVNAESITPLPTLEPLNTSPPNVTSLGAKLPERASQLAIADLSIILLEAVRLISPPALKLFLINCRHYL